jgi:hypothetical protein
MGSSKADATHWAENRYEQRARIRKSRGCAEGYEPIELDGDMCQDRNKGGKPMRAIGPHIK